MNLFNRIVAEEQIIITGIKRFPNRTAGICLMLAQATWGGEWRTVTHAAAAGLVFPQAPCIFWNDDPKVTAHLR